MLVSRLYNVRNIVGAVVGLELEVEGENLPSQAHFKSDSAWQIKRDGSLRNGLEYVFQSPRGAIATKEALEEIQETMGRTGFVADYSFRTSTHVHVNVSNLDVEVVKVMVAMFHLFEDEYINYCARGRHANRFCLGMKDADGVVDNLRTFFDRNDVPSEDRGKYSALNLCTLQRFGTIEFRILEGTNDWDRIYTWVRALLALRKAAKNIETRQALFKMNKEEIAKELFPTERLRTRFLKEGWERRYDYNHSVGFDAFRVN